MCLGENLEGKRERICPEKCSKLPNYLFIYYYYYYLSERGSRGIYIEKVTLQLWNGLMKAFLGWDWVDLGVFGKIQMFSFWNTKEFENQTVGSKVMASRSEVTRFAQFSRYLHRFKPNSNP